MFPRKFRIVFAVETITVHPNKKFVCMITIRHKNACCTFLERHTSSTKREERELRPREGRGRGLRPREGGGVDLP